MNDSFVTNPHNQTIINVIITVKRYYLLLLPQFYSDSQSMMVDVAAEKTAG